MLDKLIYQKRAWWLCGLLKLIEIIDKVIDQE